MLSINKKNILISLGVFVFALVILAFAICHSGINAFADELNPKVNITYSGEKHRVNNGGIIGTYWDTATVDVDYSLGDKLEFDLNLYDPAGKEDAFWPWENDKYQRHKITLNYSKNIDGNNQQHYTLTMFDSCPDYDAGINGTIYWKNGGSEPTDFDIDTMCWLRDKVYPLPEIDYIVFRANE